MLQGDYRGVLGKWSTECCLEVLDNETVMRPEELYFIHSLDLIKTIDFSVEQAWDLKWTDKNESL